MPIVLAVPCHPFVKMCASGWLLTKKMSLLFIVKVEKAEQGPLFAPGS